MRNKLLISLVAVSLLIVGNVNANQSNSQIKRLKEKIADLEEAIEDLEERTDTIETRSYTDKIQFRLGMRVEANKIEETKADGSSNTKSTIYRTKLNLNMKTKIRLVLTI